VTLYKRWLIPLIITVLVIALDFLTKWLTQSHIPYSNEGHSVYPFGGIPIFENFFGIQFAIIHNINRGAAWGVFWEWQHVLLVLRILLIICLMIYAVKNKNRVADIPLALIIGGAVGNVIDYFVYGHVVDMLQFVFWGYHYPTFNLADAAIFLGIVSLLIINFKKHPSEQF